MVKVGVGVFILHENKILLMKRKGAHGNNTWAPPGGHLEMGETFFECAQREAQEELGILVKDFSLIGITNDIFSENAHYITIHTLVAQYCNQPSIMEPEKCLQLEWFALDNLPAPLFLPIQNLLKSNPTIFEHHYALKNNQYMNKDLHE